MGDADESYLRVLQILGRVPIGTSMLVRPLPMSAATDSATDATRHPWAGRWGTTHTVMQGRIEVDDPQFQGIYLSAFPENGNEGALTPGRYLTTALQGGASLRLGRLTVSLRPMAAWVQNGDFELAPVKVSGQPKYAYPWRRIDEPQRFGPDPFWQFDWGQSEMRLDLGPASVSYGTTNMWWGPGTQNAILMSNNAAGFPHATLETSHPLDIGIGRLEALWMFGRLQGTQWFDSTVADNGRYITGAALAYTPTVKALRGLSVGVGRVFYAEVPPEGLGAGEYLLIFQTPLKAAFATGDNHTGDDTRDQMISLFGRWVFPESGFEVYGEWARNDNAWGFREYFLTAGNTAAFTLGLQKATPLSGGDVLVLSAEATRLDNPNDSRAWPNPPYYEHGFVPRGYTNKGQIIGAAVGTGGTAQFVGAELYAPWGGASLYARRQLFDLDAWLQTKQAGVPTSDVIDGALSLGGTYTWFRGSWDLQASLEHTLEFDRYRRYLNDVENVRLSLGARLRLGLMHRLAGAPPALRR
ncbi:MAG TPA: capsule assembly Wzi family protein [Gemmatimonadaceae bacterium]|nr:capsule assembly Wzi family protein [Gemmatimonadaceae bacterium]